MDLKKLRYFVSIAETGGFTKAAAQLNVAQSALSLHVRQLEDEFGTQLLIRERSGVTLTTHGKKLLNHAKIILNQVQIAQNDLISEGKILIGDVVVGIPSGPARFLVPKLLLVAQDRHPRITIKIIEAMSGYVEERLISGHLDLAVLYRIGDASLPYEVLAREELCLITPPNNHNNHESINFTDLPAFPLALPMASNSARITVAEAATRLDVNLNVRYEVDSLSTILSLVNEGKAYSILPRSAVDQDVETGKVCRYIISNPPITRDIYLAGLSKGSISAEVSVVHALLIEIVRSLVAEGHWHAVLPDNNPQ